MQKRRVAKQAYESQQRRRNKNETAILQFHVFADAEVEGGNSLRVHRRVDDGTVTVAPPAQMTLEAGMTTAERAEWVDQLLRYDAVVTPARGVEELWPMERKYGAWPVIGRYIRHELVIGDWTPAALAAASKADGSPVFVLLRSVRVDGDGQLVDDLELHLAAQVIHVAPDGSGSLALPFQTLDALYTRGTVWAVCDCFDGYDLPLPLAQSSAHLVLHTGFSAARGRPPRSGDGMVQVRVQSVTAVLEFGGGRASAAVAAIPPSPTSLPRSTFVVATSLDRLRVRPPDMPAALWLTIPRVRGTWLPLLIRPEDELPVIGHTLQPDDDVAVFYDVLAPEHRFVGRIVVGGAATVTLLVPRRVAEVVPAGAMYRVKEWLSTDRTRPPLLPAVLPDMLYLAPQQQQGGDDDGGGVLLQFVHTMHLVVPLFVGDKAVELTVVNTHRRSHLSFGDLRLQAVSPTWDAKNALDVLQHEYLKGRELRPLQLKVTPDGPLQPVWFAGLSELTTMAAAAGNKALFVTRTAQRAKDLLPQSQRLAPSAPFVLGLRTWQAGLPQAWRVDAHAAPMAVVRQHPALELGRPDLFRKTMLALNRKGVMCAWYDADTEAVFTHAPGYGFVGQDRVQHVKGGCPTQWLVFVQQPHDNHVFSMAATVDRCGSKAVVTALEVYETACVLFGTLLTDALAAVGLRADPSVVPTQDLFHSGTALLADYTAGRVLRTDECYVLQREEACGMCQAWSWLFPYLRWVAGNDLPAVREAVRRATPGERAVGLATFWKWNGDGWYAAPSPPPLDELFVPKTHMERLTAAAHTMQLAPTEMAAAAAAAEAAPGAWRRRAFIEGL